MKQFQKDIITVHGGGGGRYVLMKSSKNYLLREKNYEKSNTFKTVHSRLL